MQEKGYIYINGNYLPQRIHLNLLYGSLLLIVAATPFFAAASSRSS